MADHKESRMKHTPLYEVHKESGAKMVDFFGWEMPLSYSGVVDEHETVRTTAGLFDISHMGRFVFQGPQAEEGLQKLVTRDLRKLAPGAACYSVLCNTKGGILDDIVVYKKASDDLLMVVNASNRDKILDWCKRHLSGVTNIKFQDRTEATAMLALQGPATMQILGQQNKHKPWHFHQSRLLDQEVMIAQTGYTGEPGVEIFVEASATVKLWKGLMTRGQALGLKPAGLGARDTLRLEMGYALYGNDIDEQTTPLEADLGWVVDFDKPDFIGKSALQTQKEKGVEKKLIGFKLLQPGVPRKGYKIYSDGKQIGTVTSGNMSPMLNKGIGMGYVQVGYCGFDSEILIEIRDKVIPAVVVKRPFYQKK
jgi:aminomethyltransferase